MPPVRLITPSGDLAAVEDADVQHYLDQGYRHETPLEQGTAYKEWQREKLYDNPENKIQAFGEGTLRGLTFGLSDPLLRAAGRSREDMQARKELHPWLAGTGEFVGVVGSAGLGAAEAGGVKAVGALERILAKAPAGLSARAARSVALRIGEETTAKRITGAVLESAIDGGLFGAGQAISQATLNDDPITVEAVVAGFGTGALMGGGIGGGLAGASVAAGAIRRRLASTANPLLHAASAGSKELGQHVGTVARSVDSEVEAALTRAQNQRAGRIIEERDAAVSGFAVDPTRYDEALGNRPASLLTEDARVSRAEWEQAQKQGAVLPGGAAPPVAPVRMAEGTPEMSVGAEAGTRAGKKVKPGRVFAEGTPSPGQAHTGPEPSESGVAYANRVAREEFSPLLQEYKAARQDVLKRFPDFNVDMATLSKLRPAQAAKSINAWERYGQALAQVDAKAGTQLSASMGERVLHVDTLHLTKPEAARAIEGLRNVSTQDLAAALRMDVASLPKVTANSPAELLLKGYGLSRYGDDFAAKGGVKAATGKLDKVKTAGKGLVDWGTRRAAYAAAWTAIGHPGFALMSLASQAGRVLKGLAIGADEVFKVAAKRGVRTNLAKGANVTLAGLQFDTERNESKNAAVARIRELQSIMSNPARLEDHIDGQLIALKAVNLDMANEAALQLSNRLQFYASKMPNLPPADVLSGFDGAPSKAEIAEWARYVEAGENPGKLLEELASGHVRPETVETVKTVYPALYGYTRQLIAERLIDLRTSLPYGKRLSLSQAFDLPVESTATPEMAFYAAEMYGAQAQEQAQPPRGPGLKSPAPTKGQMLSER